MIAAILAGSNVGGKARGVAKWMDVCLARNYLAVASTGGFVTAAEKLNITQPAVSTRIRALEEQLGSLARRFIAKRRSNLAMNQ